MTGTSRVIPAIKGDRAGRPWVELGGDGLDGIDISECVFVLPLWDMSDIDHVHCFDHQVEISSVPPCSAGEIRPRLRCEVPSLCVRR